MRLTRMTVSRIPLASFVAPLVGTGLLVTGCAGGTPEASPGSTRTSVAASASTPSDDRSHVAAPTTTDEPDPGAPSATENTHWEVVDRAQADVDGDGRPEGLRLRAPRGMGHGSPLQVVTTLADGTTTVTGLEHQAFGGVYRVADIDGVPGQEVFVLREDPRRTTTVLTWRDGALVAMTTPSGHAITDDYVDRHKADWWVRDGVLRSSLSVRPFRFTYESVETPDNYAVHTWRWRVDGLALTRHRIPGTFCVVADAPYRLYACE